MSNDLCTLIATKKEAQALNRLQEIIIEQKNLNAEYNEQKQILLDSEKYDFTKSGVFRTKLGTILALTKRAGSVSVKADPKTVKTLLKKFKKEDKFMDVLSVDLTKLKKVLTETEYSELGTKRNDDVIVWNFAKKE